MPLENIVREGENGGPLFPHYVISTLSQKNGTIRATMKLSSANAFSVDKVKVLSSGKCLTLYQTTKLLTGPN